MVSTPSKKLFIFGVGYVGQAVAKAVQAKGWTVYGSYRNAGQRDALTQRGIHPIAIDAMENLPAVSHILHTAPPVNGDDPLFPYCTWLEHCAPEWFGYLSTTGVYGDHQGDWVDETTPTTHPDTPRGIARLACENAWQATALPVHIFRLGGIYGPNRNAIENNSQNIYKPDHYFSRIHVEDIVAVLLASMHEPHPGAVYNVVDDMPTPPHEPIEFAAKLQGIAPPTRIPFDRAELSPMAKSFYDNNKRVRNDRIKHELGVRLRYPTYREGLTALWTAHLAKRTIS